MKSSTIFAVCAAVASLCLNRAVAVEIVVEFAGVSGNGNVVVGTFSYDPEAAPCELPECLPHPTEPNPKIGRYPLGRLELSVDGAAVEFDNPSQVVTVINGDSAVGALDRLSISYSDNTQSFDIELTDLSGTLFVDDRLPLSFSRDDFDTAHPTGLINGASLGEDGTGDVVVLQPVIDSLEEQLRLLATDIKALELSLFLGPNNRVREARRNVLAWKAFLAAHAAAYDAENFGVRVLKSLLKRIDGRSRPRDWMVDGAEKMELADRVDRLKMQLAATP